MAERADPAPAAHIAVVGDVHGHLQLALCMVARWQAMLETPFEAVFLAGDVGTFTDESQLDSATRSHARDNECELEFLQQWAVTPQPPWIERIFEPAGEVGGLGLTCPVVMVHGNHEGFLHLETMRSRGRLRTEAVPIEQLRGVDTAEHILYLPSGWRCRTASGAIVGGLGGIESGQRPSRYHSMAFIDDDAVEGMLDAGPLDILVTHQGPANVQGDHGSPTLDVLLDAGIARAWFHGHSTPVPDATRAGPGGCCEVVPLGDVAFSNRGRNAGDPGLHGWARAAVLPGGSVQVTKETPPFWRDLRKSRWMRSQDGRLVAPDLAAFAR
jgi:predicted phosphodiesterase